MGGNLRWPVGAGLVAAVLLLSAVPAVAEPVEGAALDANGVDLDRTSPPIRAVTPDFVSSSTRVARKRVPILLAGRAVPFGYYVDRALAQQFGTDAVVAAMQQWDGVEGTRWSTEFLGLVQGKSAAALPDGRSVVFLDDACSQDHGGHAYRQMESSRRDTAYGALAVYVHEVDIGVCPSVLDVAGLRSVVAHEVGHALGLDHLCDPGQECWQPGMGPGPHTCRVMYHGPGACWPQVEERDHEALRHLYPTLQRLAGPGREETAARVSYATFADSSLRRIVVARSDDSAHGPLAAAALAAAYDAPLLLARPADRGCLTGPAWEEIARLRQGMATIVLVGDWPANCSDTLTLRFYGTQRIRGDGWAELATAIADRVAGTGRMRDAAVLVSGAETAEGHLPDAVAGGAAAAAARGPILYTGHSALPGAVVAWLEANPAVTRMYVVGGASVIDDAVLGQLRALGIDPVRVAGEDRVTTALALADRSELFPGWSPVLVAGADRWPDAVTGAAFSGLSRIPVIVTGSRPDPRIERWLEARRPASGYVLGGTGAVPSDVQRAYTRFVGTSP